MQFQVGAPLWLSLVIVMPCVSGCLCVCFCVCVCVFAALSPFLLFDVFVDFLGLLLSRTGQWSVRDNNFPKKLRMAKP